MNMKAAAIAVGLTLGFSAFAAEPEPSKAYTLSTEGSTASVKPNGKGLWVLSIRAAEGAHVSSEAPLKIELTGKEVTLAKATLGLADAVGKPAPGQEVVSPRFEVPFTASAGPSGQVDAKVTFFICTDKLCSRQQKNLSLAIEVK